MSCDFTGSAGLELRIRGNNPLPIGFHNPLIHERI